MPSYLWPMTSLCPVLVGYRLVRSGPCACLPSMYVQKSACCSLVRRGLEACQHSLSFVLWPFMWAAFWFPTPPRGWYLFITGLYTSFGPFLDCPHFLPYYSVIPVGMAQFCWASLGPPFTLSPSGLTWSLVFLLMGSCVPFAFSLGHPWLVCFLWASSSLLLTLYSYGLLLTSLGFLGPITSFSSLGFMGLPLIPYFLCLHYFWAYSGPFSLFLHHILPMGMLFLSFRASLSPFTSSRPICLFHELVIHRFNYYDLSKTLSLYFDEYLQSILCFSWDWGEGKEE